MAVKLSDIVKVYENREKSGDFQEWLEKLETVAELQELKGLEKVVPLFLAGSAYAVYKELSGESRKSYPTVKAALLKAFSDDPFKAYSSLKARVLNPGEPVDAFYADICKWAKLMGLSEEAGEPLIRCAFVGGAGG